MYNIDGGYLTFKLAFGGFDNWLAKHGTQVSMFAVDSKSKRKYLYPDYKKYRNAKGDKDAVIEMVWALRKEVQKEAKLPLCQIDGLEADDLVACWYLFNQDQKIVGVDKDFFQLPNLEQTYYHSMKPYNVIEAIGNLPAYVQQLASRNFALYQILLGDVADNIPRLLAKGKEGKQQIESALYADDKGILADWLLDTFGESVKVNAGLVLLPYFEYGDFAEFTNWFECWCKGHYYDRGNWQKLYFRMQQEKLQNKVVDDFETWQMFSLI